MIHYQLQCGAEHGFDGWFRDSAAFEDQAQRRLLSCPVCGDARVSRALMAPAVAKKRQPAPPAPTPAPPTALVADAGGGVIGGVLPDKLRAALQRLRAEVERNCVDVGADFAAEARRIHNGESERRGIYGETTPEQADSLAEDGIEIARIPWVPRADG